GGVCSLCGKFFLWATRLRNQASLICRWSAAAERRTQVQNGNGSATTGVTQGVTVCLAIPGKIVELDALNPQLAVVDVVGVRRKVDLGLLQDDLPVLGDWVLIHV